MEICGATLSSGETTYFVVAAIACLSLLLAPLASWIASHYQRVDTPRTTRWRPPEEREELKDE